MTEPAADAAGGCDREALESGRRLFAGDCRFVAGAARAGQLPPAGLPEVAFAGRSNVGKSSLINALTGRRALARTSGTPGRTRELNFFVLGGRLGLVDLPGYGYARVSRRRAEAWHRLLRDYLAGRPTLRRCCLLVDARHGLKDSDRGMMQLLDAAAVPYQVVLTKADKVDAAALCTRAGVAEVELRRHAAAMPAVLPTSAVRAGGVAELRAALAALARDREPE